MIQSLFEFFQAFAASILSAIGIPLSFAIPVSKMLAVVAMFVTAVYLLRLTAQDWNLNLRATSHPEFDAWRWHDY